MFDPTRNLRTEVLIERSDGSLGADVNALPIGGFGGGSRVEPDVETSAGACEAIAAGERQVRREIGPPLEQVLDVLTAHRLDVPVVAVGGDEPAAVSRRRRVTHGFDRIALVDTLRHEDDLTRLDRAQLRAEPLADEPLRLGERHGSDLRDRRAWPPPP